MERKQVLKLHVSYSRCQPSWRKLSTDHHSHWLQLKTLSRIQKATTRGLGKVRLASGSGTKVKTWIRIHKGWGSCVLIFLFSLDLTWGWTESWNCAAITDNKNSRRNTFFPDRGLGKRQLRAGDCEADPFFLFISLPALLWGQAQLQSCTGNSTSIWNSKENPSL